MSFINHQLKLPSLNYVLNRVAPVKVSLMIGCRPVHHATSRIRYTASLAASSTRFAFIQRCDEQHAGEWSRSMVVKVSSSSTYSIRNPISWCHQESTRHGLVHQSRGIYAVLRSHWSFRYRHPSLVSSPVT